MARWNISDPGISIINSPFSPLGFASFGGDHAGRSVKIP
jgi:hypothetical protein